MAVIEVEHLVQDYGSGRGVFDISFSIEKGEVFGFLGPNGAGKSTTIRHIMGFSKAQKGSTKVFGMESFSCYDKILESVGYLPGEIALPDGLSGWEFIDMMSKLRKTKNDQRLNMLLARFTLDPSVETKRMSLGDKRKLAIVTAFMHDPQVLILDEPTSGLDPVMQNEFIEFIKEEKERGKTILLSSHIFSEVEATCDRIAIIKDGQIVSHFMAKEFKHNQNKTYFIAFESDKEKENFIKDCPFEVERQNEGVLIKVHDSQINLLTNYISKFKITQFKQIKFTLEEHFMGFYKNNKDFGGQL
ncbi:MAG: ATP-binding cassette domain-containing protein [Clostridia bacterium]|nr:ATP-binding cassette domain-containing protein [Clostridia bacterium]